MWRARAAAVVSAAAIVAATLVAAGPAEAIPAAGAAPTVTPGSLSLTVTWSEYVTPTTGPATYAVVLTAAGTPVATHRGTQTSWTFTGLTPSTGYVATVKEYDADNVNDGAEIAISAPSPTTYPRATVPSPPSAPTGSAGSRQVTLRWNAPTGLATGGSPITGYAVVLNPYRGALPLCKRGESVPCVAATRATTTSRTVRNLRNDRTYSFRVRAVTRVGQSSPSASSPVLQPFSYLPPFSLGMKSPAIKELQTRLTWAGLDVKATGTFDAATKKQVKHLQEKFLYDETGVVGTGLWRELRSITSSKGVLPKQCRGTALCVSKKQRILRYVMNNKVVKTVDVRFGPEGGGLSTPEGLFQINWKAEVHESSEYHTPMPFTMNFHGGAAVHYSKYFAADGYWGNSHGCVNVRDWNGVKWIFRHASVGTPVYVYSY